MCLGYVLDEASIDQYSPVPGVDLQLSLFQVVFAHLVASEKVDRVDAVNIFRALFVNNFVEQRLEILRQRAGQPHPSKHEKLNVLVATASRSEMLAWEILIICISFCTVVQEAKLQSAPHGPWTHDRHKRVVEVRPCAGIVGDPKHAMCLVPVAICWDLHRGGESEQPLRDVLRQMLADPSPIFAQCHKISGKLFVAGDGQFRAVQHNLPVVH
mmetsp:Transcript_86351/g.225243  ORF Transcript_86351/g.225243 Transcript_86351/m.225243 type:complete len:213 (+) Transcript_86351:172-810(+)